jgi:hypothetical protein
MTATAEAERREVDRALELERVRQAQLETRRQEIVYPVKAYGPWVILFVLIAVAAWAGYRLVRAYEIRLRAVPRDDRGDAPVLVLQQGPRLIAYDPDRAVGPATVFDVDVHQPQLVDREAQERTTARDQAIDLTSRGLPRRQKRGVSQARGRRMFQRAGSTPASQGLVRVVPPAAVRPWLQEVRPQALRRALVVEGEVLSDSEA